ncbi:hypothetical protein [Candidatus Poriferisodalis sp.]|uniref:hypothetical protein n=1 Tax=Candidatus Poriferisodalis sp. TaxID=3101277 RepID=UPI003B0247D7
MSTTDPNGWGGYGLEATGTLRIVGKCAYLDNGRDGLYSPDYFSRYVLSLPSNLVQYDETNNEFWLHRQMHVQGPLTTGDEVIVGEAVSRGGRSAACGNHPIMSTDSLQPCEHRYRYPCNVAFYSRNYGVPPSEAKRRLDRALELESVLAQLHAAEPQRTAGWGIDHADPGAERGIFTDVQRESFLAWLRLIGDEPPNETAAAIAAAHDDVEIRLGAGTSYVALRSAQHQLTGRHGIILLREASDSDGRPVELTYEITRTRIDFRSSSLNVEAVVRRDSFGNRPEPRPFREYRPHEGTFANGIERDLDNVITVPITVSWEWADRDF